MAERSSQPRRDLLSRPAAVIAGYGIPIAVMVAAGTVDLSKSATAAIWAVSVLVMGLMCAANARQCGRVHCYFTAPFLFVMAVVILLFGFNVLTFIGLTFQLLGNVLGIGSALLCVVSELAFGRYFSRVERHDG